MMLDLREVGALKALRLEGLRLKKSQKIDLLLAEIPGTGYSWEIDKNATSGIWTFTS